MKKTTIMTVNCMPSVPRGQLVMHPNEGSDLGLFTKSHPMEWCTGLKPEEFLKGSSGTVISALLELLNECPHNILQMNSYDWERLGMPEKAVLFLDGKRLFLHGTKK